MTKINIVDDLYCTFHYNQLEPDIKAPNEPGEVSKGRDQQLEAAVKELLKTARP